MTLPKKLSQLETPYTDSNCLDTAIATNMIAVGMDVDRLGSHGGNWSTEAELRIYSGN